MPTQIGIFAALGTIQSILMFVFAFGLTIAGTKSSRVLLQKAMKSTLRAPMYVSRNSLHSHLLTLPQELF